MGENAERIGWLRDEANTSIVEGSPCTFEPSTVHQIADALEASDAKIAELEAQIARDAAFNEASRHYGEADIAQALEIVQEGAKLLMQHGAKRRV